MKTALINSVKSTCVNRHIKEFFRLNQEMKKWLINENDVETVECDDGWRGFRIQGVLDFSLIGILSKLSSILAEHKIGIFAVSTYNTDYILVKEENYERALTVLASEGYTVI